MKQREKDKVFKAIKTNEDDLREPEETFKVISQKKSEDRQMAKTN